MDGNFGLAGRFHSAKDFPSLTRFGAVEFCVGEDFLIFRGFLGHHLQLEKWFWPQIMYFIFSRSFFF